MTEEASSPSAQPTWERDLINRLTFATVQEQRRTRRWGIFFKLLGFGYLFIILWLVTAEETRGLHLSGGKYTALVKIDGVIADGAEANADDVITGLRDAFEDSNTQGVILRINSPGGSPVQSAYINDEILRLRKKYSTIPLYVVISDLCASGGYYVAVAGQKIYANPGSIVGSIGVRMDAFGFVEAINKLGIERRLLTAGEHKGLLDPFLPERPEELTHIKALLADIHGQFISAVKKGRGARLADRAELFTGLVWTGAQAKELGLIDDFASTDYVAREVIGVAEIKDFSHKHDLFDRFTERFGMMASQVLAKWAGPHLN